MKRMWKSKYGIVVITAVVLVALASAYGVTSAMQLKQTNSVENIFTVGTVNTEIVEIFQKINNHEYQKEPRVTNTGNNSCYVRIRLEITPMEAHDRISLDFDTENWIKPDGSDWYYFKQEVAPGHSTTPLFTKVTVDYNETDKPWMDFDIILYQEAVQSEVTTGGETITDMTEIWNLYDGQS